MSCGSKCSLSLPQGAVGWSIVCDCGISWSCSLFGAAKALTISETYPPRQSQRDSTKFKVKANLDLKSG